MRRRAMVVELQRDADDVVAFASFSRPATTEESTPPDMATTTRVSAGRPGRSRLFMSFLSVSRSARFMPMAGI